jgi:2,4-dienoyl-CoA reductase-like NADH-dependent reductase (Old Yellow Enzyme family)
MAAFITPQSFMAVFSFRCRAIACSTWYDSTDIKKYIGRKVMATLFDRTTINGMGLKNRLVRSATWEGMCNADGRPSDKLIDCYRTLAKGEVGLIISGYAFVRPDGKQLPGKMGIHADAFASEMKALAQTVHDEGGKVCIQLVHAGGQTDTANAGRRPLAPSAVQVDQFPEVPREMSARDIADIVTAFGDAAGRAKAFGFDAVQLHGAHGYLINQFLSPLTNRRTDEYGGSVGNRCRFLMEVYRRVRENVGENYPVMIKLNGADFVEGGLSAEDALHAAALLDREGIDAIEVSGGTSASGDKSPVRTKIDRTDQEAYNLDLAGRIKGAVRCPVMVVGGFRSYEVAEEAVKTGRIDYISMARPLIREPNLPRRWKEGDTARARCISCNGCFRPGLKEGGIYCVVEAEEKKKGKK